MNPNERPIPVRSVVCLPRWLWWSGLLVGSVCLLGGVAMLVYAVAGGPPDTGAEWYGAWFGGAGGCLAGGAASLFGVIADLRRHRPATDLFELVQHDGPLPFYRRVFWPALAVAALAAAVGIVTGTWAWVQGLVLSGGMLALIAGIMEVVRRHTTRQAKMLFALYADGLLGGEDTAAIDAARARQPKFDAAVRAYQAVAARLQAPAGEA